mmetsp:Transcript_21686/g.35778  ORF Transcript_21686/g.35778 Transcript_21686/m.35778 type:complete len:89 (+) Transcript_21686:416-682(+)
MSKFGGDDEMFHCSIHLPTSFLYTCKIVPCRSDQYYASIPPPLNTARRRELSKSPLFTIIRWGKVKIRMETFVLGGLGNVVAVAWEWW